jgi:hypothetical protein
MQHDKLGSLLEVGDCVVFSGSMEGLGVGRIAKFTSKMVRINGFSNNQKPCYKYATDLAKIDPQVITMYLLKKGK